MRPIEIYELPANHLPAIAMVESRPAHCFSPRGFTVALGRTTEQNQRLQSKRIAKVELDEDQPSSLEKKSRTHELATQYLFSAE